MTRVLPILLELAKHVGDLVDFGREYNVLGQIDKLVPDAAVGAHKRRRDYEPMPWIDGGVE